jgi:hypothetical protein
VTDDAEIGTVVTDGRCGIWLFRGSGGGGV